MIITKSHLTYWRSKKQPLPSWARGVWVTDPDISTPTSVHRLINAQIPQKLVPDRGSYASNTLVVLSMARKRGELLATLFSMAREPGCRFRPERRKAYCIKWLRRISRDVEGRT